MWRLRGAMMMKRSGGVLGSDRNRARGIRCEEDEEGKKGGDGGEGGVGAKGDHDRKKRAQQRVIEQNSQTAPRGCAIETPLRPYMAYRRRPR